MLFRSSIESVMGCTGTPTLASVPNYQPPRAAPGPDYRSVPAPGPQPTMPEGAMSAAGGAGALVLTVDLAKITVPAA